MIDDDPMWVLCDSNVVNIPKFENEDSKDDDTLLVLQQWLEKWDECTKNKKMTTKKFIQLTPPKWNVNAN